MSTSGCPFSRWFPLVLLLLNPVALSAGTAADDHWPQFKFDSRNSGYAAEHHVAPPLGLVGAVPLSDAIFTSPVVAAGRVYVVDGSGTAWCFHAETLQLLWRTSTSEEGNNCNNVSSPAVVDRYVHFGTTAGTYYVLDAATGKVVRKIPFGDPIFSSPAVCNGRAYCATLGGRVFCVEADGRLCWTWDYVREQLGFEGNRWSAADWLAWKGGRVTWRDQFCCPWDVAVFQSTVVAAIGGRIVRLADRGDRAEPHRVLDIPKLKGSEYPGLFGLSVSERGSVFCQWHRRDNTGRVDALPLQPEAGPPEMVADTLTRNDLPGSLGFASVSIRDHDVFRCRPEEGFGLCRHRVVPPTRQAAEKEPRAEVLAAPAAIASPIVLRNCVVYGTLDGRLIVVPFSDKTKPWSFETPFGAAISAPPAICRGQIYFGCEDGYLYVLGPGGQAAVPKKDLQVWKIRTLPGSLSDQTGTDWFTNFGDLQNRNATSQCVRPPVEVKWIRRFEGTFKHLPVCGGGRMYTHTAEGQIVAVEQETGRFLWRKYFPGVHVSYTAPLYWQERLLVPQAGLEQSRLRCLDAATGELLWEVPFSGSPSWSRQQPPVVCHGLAIYMFSTGKYAPKGTGIFVFRGSKPAAAPAAEATVSWLYSHDNPYYPENQRPIVCAWDLESGRVVWRRDFSQYGHGGDDAGLCLMNDTLYYSCFFGYAARRGGKPGPRGITAALDPRTGRTLWLTTEHSVTAGATLSAEQGRLYLGGYNAWDSKDGARHVWCLDARDGSLLWKSDPLVKAINVVTVGPRFLFAFAYGGQGYLLDKQSGKILSKFNHKNACTRFTLAGRYLLGPNADLIDTAAECRVVSSGPPVDARECVGAVVSGRALFYTAQATGLQMALQMVPKSKSSNDP